ncbi:Amyloid protein-binding protein 2 [Clonorchis sinensis]|uniref:Amyloid protein-binding protein 2 n=1 Tax=Clonorchis sinensis TaxID=79923 RepID=A0A8T1MG74_CLOSI|nr:Amyloid protein-binding protein 2 [Clonorchis sinensis]
MPHELLRRASPIHYFCMTGDIKSMKQLLDNGDDGLLSMDHLHCWTPAHWAANFGRVDCLGLLNRHGATSTPSFRSMLLPLHIACERGFLDCVRLLLGPTCKINTQDAQGETPLHKAARSGHLEAARLLLQAGALPNVRNFSNRTPTELAAFAGHFEVAALINEFIHTSNGHSVTDVSMDNTFIPVCWSRDGNSCKRQSLNALTERLDKRRRFDDPVWQIATDMAGPTEQVESSLLEHASSINMADVYASQYADYLGSSNGTRCQ